MTYMYIVVIEKYQENLGLVVLNHREWIIFFIMITFILVTALCGSNVLRKDLTYWRKQSFAGGVKGIVVLVMEPWLDYCSKTS